MTSVTAPILDRRNHTVNITHMSEDIPITDTQTNLISMSYIILYPHAH